MAFSTQGPKIIQEGYDRVSSLFITAKSWCSDWTRLVSITYSAPSKLPTSLDGWSFWMISTSWKQWRRPKIHCLSTLPHETWVNEENAHCLVNARWTLGFRVWVRMGSRNERTPLSYNSRSITINPKYFYYISHIKGWSRCCIRWNFGPQR